MDDMISVDGKIFKCPASFKWKKSDISASDAGRTDDTQMHKNKVGESAPCLLAGSACQKRKSMRFWWRSNRSM